MTWRDDPPDRYRGAAELVARMRAAWPQARVNRQTEELWGRTLASDPLEASAAVGLLIRERHSWPSIADYRDALARVRAEHRSGEVEPCPLCEASGWVWSTGIGSEGPGDVRRCPNGCRPPASSRRPDSDDVPEPEQVHRLLGEARARLRGSDA